MNLVYVYTKLRYNGHHTLIVARNKPNWFERLLLGRQTEIIHFIGHGTKWCERDAAKKVVQIENARLLKRLQAIEAGVKQDHKNKRLRGMTLNSKAIK